MPPRPKSKHLLDEEAALEEGEVAELFAGADETRGNAEFVLNGDDHAAFAAAVELGDDDAGEPGRFVKLAGLAHGVAAGGGIDDEQRFVRRLRVGFGRMRFTFAIRP